MRSVYFSLSGMAEGRLYSWTSEHLSPLSHLESPGVGLREERRLKAGPDEKRGCHSIVARLAHPLMELYWGRAPRGSTPPRGGMYKPKINYCRGHGTAPSPSTAR